MPKERAVTSRENINGHLEGIVDNEFEGRQVVGHQLTAPAALTP